jgi:hypothetical protein
MLLKTTNLKVYDAVLLGRWFLAVRKTVVPFIFKIKQSCTARMKHSLTLNVKTLWHFEMPGTNTMQQFDATEDMYRVWLIYLDICNIHRCSESITGKLCEFCKVFCCSCSTVCCLLFDVHTNWDTVTETVNCVYFNVCCVNAIVHDVSDLCTE